MSNPVMAVGAASFGADVGYVTYRTLIRTEKSSITDLGAVVSVIGGGAVTGLFNPDHSDLFGWYSIGLASGMIVYWVVFRLMNTKKATAQAMIAMPDKSEEQALSIGGTTQ